MELHASGEDYLEAVLILQKQTGMVRSIDLARHMVFQSPASAMRSRHCGKAASSQWMRTIFFT